MNSIITSLSIEKETTHLLRQLHLPMTLSIEEVLGKSTITTHRLLTTLIQMNSMKLITPPRLKART